MDKIAKTRRSIDKIDSKLSKLLSLREENIKTLKQLKNNQKLPIRNKSREKNILEKLDNEYQRNIFKKIISESRKIQQ